MKKFLLCCLSLSFSFFKVNAQLPAGNLVAYYPFCNGDTADYSGNGYTLNRVGAVPAPDINNRPNNAYQFNGASALYRPILPTGSSVTYACWFYADTAQYGTIVINGHTGFNGYGFEISGGTSYQVGTKLSAFCGNIGYIGSQTVSMQTWHHAALVRSGTTWTFYVDTTVISTSTISFNTPNGEFCIGMNHNSGTVAFRGRIDEVVAYSRALSLSEIKQLYHFTSPQIYTQPSSVTVSTGGTAVFTVGATGGATYQWQQNAGSGFSNLTNTPPYSGVNTNTLTVTGVSNSLNNTTYRCIISDPYCWYDTSQTVVLTVTPFSCPTVTNLPDTIDACNGATVQLNPGFTGPTGTSMDTTWTPATGLSNPHVINPTVTVGSSGQTYVLSVPWVAGSNLVVNGDFSSGNTGFTSSYIPGTGGSFGPISNAGEYLVTTNPSLAHNLFASFGDHTTGTGQMMVINGASTANVSLWCQSVTVQPNTWYDFSTWVATAYAQSPAILQFSINNVLLATPFTAPSVTGTWSQFHTTWFSGSNTTANICITNQNTAFNGNDFVLDDIAFKEVCISTDSVFVKPVNLQVSIDTLIKRGCHGDSVSFSANFTGSTPASLAWTFGDGGTSNQQNPNHVYTMPGSYTVKLVASLNGCKDSTTIQVNIAGNATVANFNSNPVSVCLGKPIQFTSTSSGPAPLTYYWNFGDATASTSTTQAHTYAAPGTYTVAHAVTSAGNCTDTIKKAVVVKAPDTTDKSIEICKDSSFTFAGQVISAAGQYSHVFTNLDGCDSLVRLDVSISPSPDANFTYVSTLNEPAVFTNGSTNAVTYYWDFGDSTNSTEKDPVHQYTRSDNYTVCLTVWSANGCIAKTCKALRAEIITAIDVPQAFTPNGDGNNDILFVRGGGIREFTLKLYNRWGQLIFETSDLKKGWDGDFHGAKPDMESVAYVLQATFIDNKHFQKQGNITIIR